MPGDEGNDYMMMYGEDGRSSRLDNVLAPRAIWNDDGPGQGADRVFLNEKVIYPSDWGELQEAIENNNTPGSWDVLRIPPNHTVSGEGQTVTINPSDPDGGPRRLVLDAPQTTFEATGTAPSQGDALLFIDSDEAPGGWGGKARVSLNLGDVSGPGTGTDSWIFVKGTDSTIVELYYDDVDGMWGGVEIENDDSFSENWTVMGDFITATKFGVSLNNSGGFPSFQGLRLDSRFNNFPGGLDSYGIYMPDGRASLVESVVRTKCFVGTSTEYAMGANLDKGFVYLNVDQGGSNGNGVQCLANCNDPTWFFLEHNGISTVFDESGFRPFSYWERQASTAKTKLKFGEATVGSLGLYPEIHERTSLPSGGVGSQDLASGSGTLAVSDGNSLPGSQGDLIFIFNDGSGDPLPTLNIGSPT